MSPQYSASGFPPSGHLPPRFQVAFFPLWSLHHCFVSLFPSLSLFDILMASSSVFLVLHLPWQNTSPASLLVPCQRRNNQGMLVHIDPKWSGPGWWRSHLQRSHQKLFYLWRSADFCQMHHDNTINVLPLNNISGLPTAHSNVDKEMLTHFPFSLSDTVRPVMEPSSCISLEESLEAGRPPRHFTTHTVFDLTRLQKEQTIQQFNKTFFFLIWRIYLRTCPKQAHHR